MTVTNDDVAAIGKLLEAAVQAGANTVSGVNFSVSDPARGRDTGLQAAFADAKAKADVLAKRPDAPSGARSPSPRAERPCRRCRCRCADARAGPCRVLRGVPVESGAEEITFTVSVVFELQ